MGGAGVFCVEGVEVGVPTQGCKAGASVVVFWDRSTQAAGKGKASDLASVITERAAPGMEAGWTAKAIAGFWPLVNEGGR